MTGIIANTASGGIEVRTITGDCALATVTVTEFNAK